MGRPRWVLFDLSEGVAVRVRWANRSTWENQPGEIEPRASRHEETVGKSGLLYKKKRCEPPRGMSHAPDLMSVCVSASAGTFVFNEPCLVSLFI